MMLPGHIDLAVMKLKVRIMVTNINQFSLGKFGAMLFARQTPMVAAERHQGILASINAWRERRAASNELSRLSDRELADIGVSRQEIPEVVIRGQR
jgi:uncharacterized protein YjiS (DUF1127 family)